MKDIEEFTLKKHVVTLHIQSLGLNESESPTSFAF